MGYPSAEAFTAVLDEQTLVEWLASLDAVDVVGVALDPCDCPLRRFLTVRGIVGARVDYDVVYFDRFERHPGCAHCDQEGCHLCSDCHRIFALPPVLARFVRLVDELARRRIFALRSSVDESVLRRARLILAPEAMGALHLARKRDDDAS